MSVSSVVSLLALASALALQAEGPPAAAPPQAGAMATAPPASGPAPGDDPIGALVNSVQQQGQAAAAPEIPAAPAPAPAGAPGVPLPSAPTTPSEPQPYLPGGPRPYTSLPPGTVGGVRPIYAQPLVRLPPKPQGSLDGAWTLAQGDAGGPLYQFQFNDTGGDAEIEGAWRDVRRSGALLGSGPVSSVGHDGTEVTIRFLEKGASTMSVVTLRPAEGGGWSGEMTGGGGSRPVVMRRN